MKKEPRILMIGALMKDAGKTTMSERIIQSMVKNNHVLAAVKVTVFKDKKTTIPLDFVLFYAYNNPQLKNNSCGRFNAICHYRCY
ncbi:hypothetical protein KAR48_11255 [bacterium]|nr:hypothetical protein [bacterium]